MTNKNEPKIIKQVDQNKEKPKQKVIKPRSRPSEDQRNEAKKAKELYRSIPNKKNGAGTQKGVGKPSILTQDLINKISQLILAGAYVETACAANGLARCLYYEWLKLGHKRKSCDEKDKKLIDPIYEQFNDAIQNALINAELRDIIRIDKAAEKHWQAAAWKLERKFPNRWGKQFKIDQDINVSIENSGQIDVNINDNRKNVLEMLKNSNALDAAFEVVEALSLNEPKEVKEKK